MTNASGDDGQRHTREDVSVVALARVECLTVVRNWGEWRSASEDNSTLHAKVGKSFGQWGIVCTYYVSILVGLFGGALCFAGRVAQREDDRALVEGGHVLNDLGSEGPSDGSGSDQDGWLDLLDDVAQVLHGSMILSKLLLVTSDASFGPVLHQQTLGIDEPDLFHGFVVRYSRFLEGHHNQLGDADGCLLERLVTVNVTLI